MTGFAASEALAGSQKLVWEIRSVNHRYLDLGFRLPEDFRGLEPRLRSLASEAVKRGKVDCSLKVSAIGSGEPESGVDPDRLEALRRLETIVREQWPEARPFSTFEILRWPGVLKDEAGERDALMAPALSSFEEALDSLRSAREREGQRLGEMLIERVAAIEAVMTTIDAQLAQAAPRYRDRLLERLARLDIEANPERLEQELALIAQRADVAEEADRLKAHLTEIRDVLALAEPIGRRLDFLIQELNREANTLASKVQDDDLARKAVDLKVLIEQMREQAQNIE
ncbi:MAG TPA: YicC/YloC family endoribonuclease [Gammaproteobacteria bacterium]|nr:YicC/YloC family endoribonuclease [Gammaproteobacteria bacterium]